MNRYPSTGWKQRIVLAAIAAGVGGVLLEQVAGSMAHPDAEAMAQRQRTYAAQAERAERLRELQRGDVQLADTLSGAPL